jgi:hypothetical protein
MPLYSAGLIWHPPCQMKFPAWVKLTETPVWLICKNKYTTHICFNIFYHSMRLVLACLWSYFAHLLNGLKTIRLNKPFRLALLSMLVAKTRQVIAPIWPGFMTVSRILVYLHLYIQVYYYHIIKAFKKWNSIWYLNRGNIVANFSTKVKNLDFFFFFFKSGKIFQIFTNKLKMDASP